MDCLDIKTIAGKIYDTCLDVDLNIVGWSEFQAVKYAAANSIRHAHTIKAIIDYSVTNDKKQLKILNASGLSCGHGDFSIVKYIREQMRIDLDWTVFESPANKFLNVEAFRAWIDKLSIKLELSDFSSSSQLYGNEICEYDIVVFTEIAEHLDYSAFLNALICIRERLKNDGVLILTTPNMLEWRNRVKFMLGRADFYGGDTKKDMKSGIFGHTILYDIKRLKRILEDIGFEIKKHYTFNHWAASAKRTPVKYFITQLIDFTLVPFRNSKFTIFITAGKTRWTDENSENEK
jgi:SAM-dependent methyltransferase